MDSITSKESKLVLNDGEVLWSRLWHPKERGPWPALLMRQPYGKEIASTITYAHPTWWASKGYLVVVQDVRGQGDSSGKFGGFSQEPSDTSQTHLWARSLPECNGRLGTYGFSYQGLTQLLAENGTPPPDCIAPAMTGLGECEHWASEGGAFWWHLGLSWGLQLAAQQAKRQDDERAWEQIRNSLEDKTYLKNGIDLLKKYDPKGMVNRWFEESNKKFPRWKSHEPLEEWLRQPLLLIGGWWDPHLRGILDLYERSLIAGGHPDLHVGPATHLQWWEEVQQLHLNFFNKYLQSDNNIEPINDRQQKLWNITTKKWYDINPISNARALWHLRSEGKACIDSSDGELTKIAKGSGNVAIVHDPWRPVPTIGGHLSPEPGIASRTQIDRRNDVATFTSEPFEETIQLKGVPKLELIALADRNGFDLCVAISMINQNSKEVLQLSTGVVRVIGRTAKDTQKRHVTFQPLFADIPKGARLRLSISGAAWPAIAINPGDEKHICGPPSQYCLVTTISLELSQAKLEICPLVSK